MRKLRHREVAFSRNCHVMELKFKTGHLTLGFPGGSDNKESACNVGNLGSSPGSGRSPAGGHGNPLQYSCWENSMDRGAWGLQSIRSQSDWVTNTHTHTHTQSDSTNHQSSCLNPKLMLFLYFTMLDLLVSVHLYQLRSLQIEQDLLRVKLRRNRKNEFSLQKNTWSLTVTGDSGYSRSRVPTFSFSFSSVRNFPDCFLGLSWEHVPCETGSPEIAQLSR